MIDINLIRNNKELVKGNIKKKFQNEKLELVDKVQDLDIENRKVKVQIDELRNKRNTISDEIGKLMREGKKDEGLAKKDEVGKINEQIKLLEEKEIELSEQIKKIMMVIPNIIADDVPIGEDDSKNVELERYGDAFVPDYEIPYHADICEALNGLDKESAGRTSGNGFYYLVGDIARLHEAIIAYARDFMINRCYVI